MTKARKETPGAVGLLKEYLTSASKVARRLLMSRGRIAAMIPLSAAKVDLLSDDEEERLDAFLLRFNSLAAMIQDHITRALLKAEEEDISESSKKDQRLLLEKLGALNPDLKFGTLAELRNKIAHHYPDDSAKQAEILNSVYSRSQDLLDAYDGVLVYADRKFFGSSLNLYFTESFKVNKVSI